MRTPRANGGLGQRKISMRGIRTSRPNGAGDQIDPVAEFAERLDAVVLAEGVPRGSKNGSGASIRTRAEVVVFGNRAEAPLVEAGHLRREFGLTRQQRSCTVRVCSALSSG